MAEERDIVSISLPFASGVAAGLFFFSGTAGPPWAAAAVVSVLLAASVPLVPLVCRKGLVPPEVPVTIMFLVAGLFCAVNSILLGLSGDSGPGWSLPQVAVSHLRDTIDGIPYASEGTGALVKALLTGDRSDLPGETVRVFRDSGASHILALSGLHLGMIYLLLSRILSPVGNSPSARRIRYFLIIGLSLFYCLMTGAGASIVRAFLFIFFGETARLLGRERSSIRIFLFSMTLQMALMPQVCTTLAFQLSYLAMAGICFVYPSLEAVYPASERGHGFNPMRRIWQSASLSISCQLFTTPLVWLRFHTFPEYFLITNLLALPLTSGIMVLTIVTVVLSALGICPAALVCIDDRLIQLLVTCLEIIASL